MGAISRLVNSAVGTVVRRSAAIEIGAHSTVRWWGLRGGGGRIRIGRESIVRCRIAFDSPAGRVTIGDRCYIGASHLICHTGITLGDDVIVSWGVTIVDHDSHSLDWSERRNDVADWARHEKRWNHVAIAPVTLGNKCWIGFGASILKGVTVGDGAVVGANSVVTRDVPAFSVAVGSPARVVRQLQRADEAE